jgi:hypothetical protein
MCAFIPKYQLLPFPVRFISSPSAFLVELGAENLHYEEKVGLPTSRFGEPRRRHAVDEISLTSAVVVPQPGPPAPVASAVGH